MSFIAPDTKNWTWVLERPCPECGFKASSVSREQIPELIRANAERWVDVLAADPEWLRRRPRADRWSPLEYGCHVRDVFEVMDKRLRLMLSSDDPLYENWDQDRTAAESGYEAQDPHAVAAELSSAAESLAADFESVSGSAWERPGTRSDGTKFSVETIGQYMLHDVVHHVDDVTGTHATPS
jgi:hypothetical protein